MKKGEGYINSNEHANAINTIGLNADFIIYITVGLVSSTRFQPNVFIPAIMAQMQEF